MSYNEGILYIDAVGFNHISFVHTIADHYERNSAHLIAVLRIVVEWVAINITGYERRIKVILYSKCTCLCRIAIKPIHFA